MYKLQKFLLGGQSWLEHIVVWLVFYVISLNFYIDWLPMIGINLPISRIVIFNTIYISLFIPFPYIVISYFKELFFKKGKYSYFILAVTILFLFASILFAWLDKMFLLPYKPTWLFGVAHLFGRVPYLIILTFIANWLSLRMKYQKQIIAQVELEKSQKEAELNWLRTQVNPHFLFNALNNVNSLIHINQDKASEMLVRMATIFRYTIHDKGRQTKLSDELAYIHDYIELITLKETLRNKISFYHTIEIDYDVEPMLFINFIENGIKHGSFLRHHEQFVVKLFSDKNGIYFYASNFIDKKLTKDAARGIGIANAKRRLSLLYPDRHTLSIVEKENVYSVELYIKPIYIVL